MADNMIPAIECADCGDLFEISQTVEVADRKLCVRCASCTYCDRPSVVLVPEYRCEECHDEMRRGEERRKAIDAYEGACDALRDAREDDRRVP